jgi:hypothetical protein
MRSTNIKINVIATTVVTLHAMVNTQNGVSFCELLFIGLKSLCDEDFPYGCVMWMFTIYIYIYNV